MYRCDICSYTLPSKAEGTFFDQNRVLTSPGYWEHCFGKPDFVEDMLGMYLGMFCRDTSGFTVCDSCAKMLDEDTTRAQKYGVSKYVGSFPSGTVDSHSVGMVAGTVWKHLHGSWPSTIQIGGSDDPQGTLRTVDSKKAKSSGCFVATVAFGDADACEVRLLRAFRDRRLVRTSAGRTFIRLYYRWGPGLARFVGRFAFLRGATRLALIPIAHLCGRLTDRR